MAEKLIFIAEIILLISVLFYLINHEYIQCCVGLLVLIWGKLVEIEGKL